MSDYIKVSVSRMNGDAEALREFVLQLPQSVNQLETIMETLASCWEGAAWNAFQEQVSSDIDYLTKMCSFLSNYVEHIEMGSSQYLEAEQEAYSMAKRL